MESPAKMITELKERCAAATIADRICVITYLINHIYDEDKEIDEYVYKLQHVPKA